MVSVSSYWVLSILIIMNVMPRYQNNCDNYCDNATGSVVSQVWVKL